MSLVATVVNPFTDPVPPGWDAFVAAQRLLPMWRSELLGVANWCVQSPASLVLVTEAGRDEPVALFHAGHVGLRDPRRFADSRRFPALSLTDCRLTLTTTSSGMAFAETTDVSDRVEAVRAYERAMRRRAGPGGLAFAYRELRDQDLPLVPTRMRTTLRLHPRMVLHNEWSTIDGYLATLPGKWRSQLRKIHRTVQGDPAVRVELVDGIDAADACWLAELVRGRHRARGLLQPPLPAIYFERLIALPQIRLLTYRDPDGRLLAYALMHDDGAQLLPFIWGSRSETAGQPRNLYFDMYRRLIELMVSTGRERLVLGKGLTAIKARFGARAVPLWGVVGLR